MPSKHMLMTGAVTIIMIALLARTSLGPMIGVQASGSRWF